MEEEEAEEKTSTDVVFSIELICVLQLMHVRLELNGSVSGLYTQTRGRVVDIAVRLAPVDGDGGRQRGPQVRSADMPALITCS